MVPESDHAAGNHFESEAVPGSLPKSQNNPRVSPVNDWHILFTYNLKQLCSPLAVVQVAPYGLYTEQLSGTAFTAPRRYIICLVT